MKPKFKVGDKVRCYREEDFDFVGIVLTCANTGDEWEYSVTNAPTLFPERTWPILIWESEMELISETCKLSR